MKIVFTKRAATDYLWFRQHDSKLFKRINELIETIKATPCQGMGKPEPLKHQLSGCWSRRIDTKHRLVYKVSQTEVTILSCRLHYSQK